MMKDIRVLCSHASGMFRLSVDAIISYCNFFGWIEGDKCFHLSSDLACLVGRPVELNDCLIRKTIAFLFINQIFNADMFSYDVNSSKIMFHNEKLPLRYSSIRNVLISQGFFTIDRKDLSTVIFVDSSFDALVSSNCKENRKIVTLEQLKGMLEREAEAGEKAEEFVLSFEKKRLTANKLISRICKVSDVDVGAGYDIISFETDLSSGYDRFIEVKAFSNRVGFYWSSNELQVAKIKEEHYYLYLVDLSKINSDSYVPVIISNPAKMIMESTDWLVEAEKYHVRKI